MPKFLSTEWLEEMRIAAQRWNDTADAGSIAGVSLCVQEAVKGNDGGDTRYYIAMGNGSLNVRPGDATDPDVTFTQDYETAAALHRGDMSARQAFIEGRLKVSGNVALVTQHAQTFADLNTIFAELSGRTTF